MKPDDTEPREIQVPRLPRTKAELKEIKELEEEAALAKRRKKRARIVGEKPLKPWPPFAGGLKTFGRKAKRKKGK